MGLSPCHDHRCFATCQKYAMGALLQLNGSVCIHSFPILALRGELFSGKLNLCALFRFLFAGIEEQDEVRRSSSVLGRLCRKTLMAVPAATADAPAAAAASTLLELDMKAWEVARGYVKKLNRTHLLPRNRITRLRVNTYFLTLQSSQAVNFIWRFLPMD